MSLEPPGPACPTQGLDPDSASLHHLSCPTPATSGSGWRPGGLSCLLVLWDWARFVPRGGQETGQGQLHPQAARVCHYCCFGMDTGKGIVPHHYPAWPLPPCVSFPMARALWAWDTTRPSQGRGRPGLAPGVCGPVATAAPLGWALRLPGGSWLCAVCWDVSGAPFSSCALHECLR